MAPPGVGESAASTSTPAGPLSIGTEDSPAAAMMAQLLVRAVAATGRSARVDAFGDAWQAALGAGELAVQPAYAGTLWASLSERGDPPPAADVAGEVAGLVAPEVSLLSAAKVDGTLVWLVTEATANAGITDLAGIAKWSRGKVAAIPGYALSRGDGVPGLKAVYGAGFTVSQVEDARERAASLLSGKVGIAAFRRTDYTGATGLFELADSDTIAEADPAVFLVSSKLVDAEPDQVLAIVAVAEKLTTDALLRLQAQVAAGGIAADVADAWLKEQGLA